MLNLERVRCPGCLAEYDAVVRYNGEDEVCAACRSAWFVLSEHLVEPERRKKRRRMDRPKKCCPVCRAPIAPESSGQVACKNCSFVFLTSPLYVEPRTIYVNKNQFPKMELTEGRRRKMEAVRQMVTDEMLRCIPLGLDEETQFRWSDSRVKMGQAVDFYGLYDVLSVSLPFALALPISETRQTVLHEIAHLAVSIPKGRDHNDVWRDKMVEIGATDLRACGDGLLPGPLWIATCPTCERLYERSKAPLPNATYFCRSCEFQKSQLFWRQAQ